MARRRISMEKIHEIIRLKERGKLSERAISRALNISRPVVSQYLRDIRTSGLDYAAIEQMNDDTLLDILAGDRP